MVEPRSETRQRTLHKLATDIACLKDGVEKYKPILEALSLHYQQWPEIQKQLADNATATRIAVEKLAAIEPFIETQVKPFMTALRVGSYIVSAVAVIVLSLVGYIFHREQTQIDNTTAVVSTMAESMARLQARDAQQAALLNTIATRLIEHPKRGD